MKVIDLHCDTLLKLQRRDNTGDLYENRNTSLDIKRLIEGDYQAQFFAMYALPESDCEGDHIDTMPQEELLERMMESFHRNLGSHSKQIAFAGNFEGLRHNRESEKISAFLTIEDGAPIHGSMDRLKYYFDQGVRLITLTWNYENCFGFPNSDDKGIMSRGLKSFGSEAVEFMNDLGMLIDVSHLSDGGFYDVLKISKKPFIASHSNARELCNHRRNLTDDMIKKMAEIGGISGLNYCAAFLRDGEEAFARISDMVRHLNHMKNKGGEDFVALGSDYDGIDNTVEIAGPHQIDRLFSALRKGGWTEGQIEKLAYRNAERVIREVLK